MSNLIWKTQSDWLILLSKEIWLADTEYRVKKPGTLWEYRVFWQYTADNLYTCAIISVYGIHIQHHREIPSKARVHLMCQNYTIKLMKKDELHVYYLMIWGYGWLMLIIVRAYSNSLNTDTYWKHNKNNVQVSRMCMKTLCAMHFLLSLQLIFS